MKTLVLSVLVTVGLFFSAFAGEILIDDEGQVYIVEKTKRSADAFERKAVENPGTEVPVWCPPQLQITNFFYGRIIKTATNVLVFNKGESIQSFTRNMTESSEVIFLWYRFWLIVAVMVMTSGNILHRTKYVTIATIAATVFTIAAFFTAISVVAVGAIIPTAFAASCAAGIIGEEKDFSQYRKRLNTFYLLVVLALFV